MPAYLLLCLLSLGSVCHNDASPPAYPIGGPYYYGSFAAYFFPPRPIDPLPPEQVAEKEKRGEPVVIAYFDDRHRITVFERRMNGTIDRATYEYFPNHFIQRLKTADGSTHIHSYALDGRRLDP